MSVFDYKGPRVEPKPYKVPRCPVCGTPESQSPVRCPDAQKPGESWIACSKCGTSYKLLKWQAAGGGSYAHF